MDSQGTILVVEDEHTVRRLTCRILEAAGYTVLGAPHAGVALRLLETHGADISLMLTDVVMPEINGPQLAREVSRRYPHVRTLFMSGHAEDRLAGQGFDGDAAALISKPFDIAELTRRVREVLDRVT
jgi:two-component system cell cycle sensor histidine kinase/response regulator CckA